MSQGFKQQTILLIGVNHKTAPVEVREPLALKGAEEEPVKLFAQIPPVDEVLFLSTCNRVEVLFTSTDPKRALIELKELWAQKSGLPVPTIDEHVYEYRNEDAIRHIFMVASSLDSMVVGEPQILGQLKDAYRHASDFKTTGMVLNRLLHKAFSVAKKVRTETKIGSQAVSISYAAVELARKIFGELSDKVAMLIGAGEMAELAAQHLISNGVKGLIVANRTLERAVELSTQLGGDAIGLDEIEDALVKADIVISSTGAPGLVLTKDQVKRAMRPRRHRLLFLIDIAVPRDIDPAINDIENVYLYDIDDLKGVVEENKQERAKEAKKAERMVEEELLKFLSWMKTLDVLPVIQGIQEKAEAIRRRELERSKKYLGNLSDDQLEAIERLTNSIVQKILHDPIVCLRKNASNEECVKALLDTTSILFNLDSN
ncbi:Glutamyl-tRNA reductase [Dissulfuribacter thermophilus]|uniref:Glutamyl-tRNA reductase n=1 Tax=Dissulfuribacter thermophilus TaxID=1156395 RepID=A0A1B9F6P1_9BACT|nr:glutamyl-tRNA reductase [Dissulfuribacter thermophilus]OCC15441.1 Glutamyl-tRNA reductase [Dissulfuribacter thermophilus]